MAAERVPGKQRRVDRENQTPEADAEVGRARRVREPIRFEGVADQNDDEHQAEIQKVAMHVLQNQRERSLAPVAFPWLAHRATGWIGPKGFVVRAAVVVARDAEAAGRPENEKRRRKRDRAGPP